MKESRNLIINAMNKRINYLYLLVMAIIALAMPSCSDEDEYYITDVYATILKVQINDADGNNLLDPDFPGNIIGEDISIEYEGETYSVNWESEKEVASRYYLPYFFGIRHTNEYSKDWKVAIGEFDGARNYDITIPLSVNNRIFNIRLKHICEMKKNGLVENLETTVYLEGKEYKGENVTIVL